MDWGEGEVCFGLGVTDVTSVAWVGMLRCRLLGYS